MTRLYRAVSEAEYAQLMDTRQFQSIPNSLEGKFFAESAKHARQWGEAFGEKFRVVAVDVPSDVYAKFIRWEKLDQIGPAVYAELEQLRQAVIIGEVQ